MRRHLLAVIVCVLTAMLFAARTATAQRLVIMPDDRIVMPPSPRPPNAPPAIPTLKKHHIGVTIKGQLAVTQIEQVFANNTGRRLEGIYLFPLPDQAAIDKFTLDINGKTTDAEILSADKARQIYTDIVSKTRDPALMEYVGRGVVRIRVFPIEPDKDTRITLRYSQTLTSDNGLITYNAPLRVCSAEQGRGIDSVAVRVDLDSDRPLRTIYSPSHPIDIKRSVPEKAVVGYEGTNIRPESDFQLVFSQERKRGEEVAVNLAAYPDAEGGYFILFASPTDEETAKPTPKDVTFVLDTSGSMSGGKIEQARKALLFCLDNLNDGDRFQVIRFSTDVEPLFPGLVDANKANRAKASEFVAAFKAIGGTNIDEALAAALEQTRAAAREKTDRPGHVIFLTDGQPTVGTTAPDDILKRLGDKPPRVFCFGVGTDVNTHLLDKLALQSKASPQYVLPNEDLELKLSSFYARIANPILANPTLAFDGVRTSKMYPKDLPDVFKGQQIVVLGRYEKSGKATVTLAGSVDGKPRKLTFDVKFPDADDKAAKTNDYIPRLWATRRVAYLLDEIRLHGENKELKDEVVDLARKHGIVTPYTSYLIVEDEDRRNIPMEQRAMSDLGRDRAAKADGEVMYRQLREAQSGAAAVDAAKSMDAMRSASTTPAPASTPTAGSLGRGGGGGGSGGPFASGGGGKRKDDGYAWPDLRSARGRSFYRNGEKWIDGEVARFDKAPRKKIAYGSPEYFALAEKSADVKAWLAVAPRVTFVHEGTVYEIE